MLNFRKTLREVVYISQLTGVAKKKAKNYLIRCFIKFNSTFRYSHNIVFRKHTF